LPDPTARPEPRLQLRLDDVEWRDVEEQILALDLKTSRYLAINRSGRELWGALVDGATRSELVHLLIDSYDLDRDRAATDVAAFLDELDGRGLLASDPSG